MNRKISFVIGGLRGGGAEKVCVTLANGLAERGYNIDLVVLSLNGAIRDKELSHKINLINLDAGNARYSAFSLWRYLKFSKPQTVLSFNRQISVVLALLRKLTNLRFRLVSRNIIFLSIAESSKKGLWHGFISKHLIKNFYRLSDVIIAQSRAMKDDLVNYLKISEENVEVIHNPVCKEVGDFSQLNDLATFQKENYVLCVGRLEEQKAFHYAIEGFSLIASEFPTLRLKIVGQGSLEKQLKQCAVDCGVSERVDFEGYQSDMIQYYLHAKATLLTSLYEGFPNVLIESISLGTPIVAFDCQSGPNEIVVNGKNGYIVKMFNVVEFANSIRRILVEEPSVYRVNSTGSRFTTNSIVNQYELVLTKGL